MKQHLLKSASGVHGTHGTWRLKAGHVGIKVVQVCMNLPFQPTLAYLDLLNMRIGPTAKASENGAYYLAKLNSVQILQMMVSESWNVLMSSGAREQP